VAALADQGYDLNTRLGDSKAPKGLVLEPSVFPSSTPVFVNGCSNSRVTADCAGAIAFSFHRTG